MREADTPRALTLVLLFVALFSARLLGAHFSWFYQNDEVMLANGVAALVQHNDLAESYRYGPQVGYHRLVQAITMLLASDVRVIPIIMIVLSALAGAVIPLCGLLLFPFELTRAERWTLGALLTINPILWMSSSYGNSTTPSTALCVVSVTLLSRRPGRAMEAAALAIFAAAVFVRADTILATPLIGLMLWQRHGSVREVLLRGTPFALALAAVYAVLFLRDPRMATAASDVGSHLTNGFQTHFWEYLLWSMSPFAFVLAIVGVTDTAATRRPLLALMGAWAFPFFAFYYGSTTTPRYFIPGVVPVAVLSAVGSLALARLLAPRHVRTSGALIAALCVAPLFIGLGWFSPSSWKNLLRESEFETQVGPMWTGALLYKSYLTPAPLARSLRHPGFGKGNLTEHAIDSSLAAVASGSARGHTIVVLMKGWNGHVFHFYANVHGARYTARRPGPIFASETWMDIGGARIMSIARGEPQYRATHTLPLKPDDEIWMMAWTAEDETFLHTQIPDGLTLAVRGRATGPVTQYVLRPTLRPQS